METRKFEVTVTACVTVNPNGHDGDARTIDLIDTAIRKAIALVSDGKSVPWMVEDMETGETYLVNPDGK